MVAQTNLDFESITIIREYSNELMSYAASFPFGCSQIELTLFAQMDGTGKREDIPEGVR